MSTPTAIVVADCNYWMRIGITLQKCVKPALLDVLHDPAHNGIPKDEQQLHEYLTAFKRREENNLKRVIFPYQWEKLCHVCTPNCPNQCVRQGKTNSEDFDITLIVVLIINCTTLHPTNGNWRTFQPLPGDNSKAAAVIFARDIRNEINHCSPNDFAAEIEFKTYWKRLEDILKILDPNKIQLFQNLEKISLDGEMDDKIKVTNDCIDTIKCDIALCQTKERTFVTEISEMKKQVKCLEDEIKSIKSEQQLAEFFAIFKNLEFNFHREVDELKKRQLQILKKEECNSQNIKRNMEDIETNKDEIIKCRSDVINNTEMIKILQATTSQENRKCECGIYFYAF